ncbi:MAG: carbohydrate-binding protein, partial [Lachnospiraceae bacterium]|nr:carbohydrate-binding protein [Lachnospiraceae bacterium]
GAWDHDITASLYVNGKKYKQLSLAPSDSWDSWNEATEEVYLRSGKNVISIKRDEGDSGSFNLDEIVIDKYSTGATTAEVGRLISGEVYVIRDKHSGLVADVDGYSPDAGRDIHVWSYLGNNNQKWKLVDLGNGYWSFKCTYGSKRISIRDNLNLVTADENLNDLGQQWTIEPVGNYYKLRNRKNNMVLSVAGDSMSAGAMLNVAQDENKDSQLFLVDGGLRHNSTEVRELENNIDITAFDPYGRQYTLVDPVIPEGFDPFTTVNDGLAHRYEAAKATLSNGARVETEHSGYLANDGYVGGMYAGSASITFRVNIDKAGTYDLTLAYCNGFNENKKAAVTVNGTSVEGPMLTPTGGWDSWGSADFSVNLRSGVNTIVFMNKSELTGGISGDVNYDYLDINKYPNTIEGEETLYTEVSNGKHFEAEDATLASGAKVETDHNGFSGDGFVGGMYNGGAKISFNINVAEAGTYSFDLRYCNGHGADVEEKVPAVTVNGKFVTGVTLPKTGSWDSWGTVRFELPLNAGLSEVSFVNTSSLTGHAGDVNYDYLELVTIAPAPEDTTGSDETGNGNQGHSNNGHGNNNHGNSSHSNGNAGNTPAAEHAQAGINNPGRALGLNRNRVTNLDASLNVEAPVEKEAEVTFEEAFAQVTEDKAQDTKETAYIGDEETALSAPNAEKKSISPMVFAILGTLAVAILGALGYYLRGKNLNQE